LVTFFIILKCVEKVKKFPKTLAILKVKRVPYDGYPLAFFEETGKKRFAE
jgi:hypothetical protein